MDGSCGRSEHPLFDAAPATRQVRTNRRQLVGRGVLTGAAVITGVSLLGARGLSAGAAPSESQDQKIFNFALLLEYIQAGFYSEAVDHGRLRGEVREFAEIVSEHEREHVKYLQKALGPRARERPALGFGDATQDQPRFLAAAVLLENTGVAAYNGQAANLTKKALAAAAEIVSVEGRHAAWVSDLAGQDPAPRAADPGVSASNVVSTLRRTGFLKGT
jgi:rubrerythrin